MGLETGTQGNTTYLNIKEGKLVYGPKDAKQSCDAVKGTITKVEFAMEEYNGEHYDKAKITIVDGAERFLLQMNVDSGYFRAFCNALRSGDPTAEVRIKPNYQVVDGKKKSSCFVEQNGKSLKHAFTRDNPGDLPPVEKVMFKGKEAYDGSKAMAYWKNWLSSIKWADQSVASPVNEDSNPFGGSQNEDDPF
jgi:hypothetical protein